LMAWKEAHAYVINIYRITKDFPPDERFGITNQLRRAASSVTANIAEGWARYHFKDKIRFYYQARGSWAETQSFLLLARDLSYITSEKYLESIQQSYTVGKLLNGLIRSAAKQC